ncbi:MAG: hypothetical protein ACAI35_06365 [Candidatus Methylacidiphilales bacterium]
MNFNLEVQREVCKKFGSVWVPARAYEKIGIALQTLQLVPIHGVRVFPKQGVTGWYIWAGDYSADADFYQPLHTCHIDDHCPWVTKYLGLEPGFRFMIDREGFEDVWKEEAKSVFD